MFHSDTIWENNVIKKQFMAVFVCVMKVQELGLNLKRPHGKDAALCFYLFI